MDVISQLEDSNGNSSDHLPYFSIEGTSARTRPFSYEEVMSRRKSKSVVAEPIKEEEPSQFKELPAKDEAVQTQEYSSDVPEPKRMPEDPVQGSYNRKELKKEEALSDRNRRSSKPNHKTKHDVQMDAEPRHYTEKSARDRHASKAQQDDAEIRHYSEKSNRDRHAKNSRQDYHRQASDQFEDESEREIYTKHHKDVLSKDMGVEGGRRSERDIGRSQLTVNSIRIKSEIDKSGLSRHNVRKLQEFEYSEKKGRRYEELEYTERRGRRYEEFEYPEKRGRRYQEFEYPEKRSRRYEEFAYPEKRGRRYEEFAYPEKKGRRYDDQFEYPEKKSRRHEEPKSKKRRSRSPEYHRKRERSASVSPRERRMHKQKSPSISPKERRVHKQRSVSVSPRGRKHPSRRSPSVSPGARKRPHRRSASISPRGQNSHHGHSGQDYGEESLSHSFRERSGKDSSETERIRTSKNSGSNRRHGSGLGGYSPRKRKTESATKILSPPPCSPERRVATWDQPPASTIANNLSSTTKSNEFPLSTPTTATPAKSQTEPPSNTPATLLEISVDSIQLTQATRPKRRLYIENLPNSASDKAVIEWLNDFLRSSCLSHYHGNSPCISCITNKERCQAVVEFLTPEDATAALSLDGKSFLGSILKVRRPKDFIDTATVVSEKAADVAEVSHVVSDVVKNSSQKVFIGGISKALTSGMLSEIVRSFGTLKAYQFEVNEFGEPYVFLEYLDPGVTHNACTGLNGMKLGGQVLTVVKAFPDSKLDEGHLESLPSNEIPMHAMPLLMKATKVLKITNVFNMEEFMLLPDAELEETLEDVRIECARFGTVKSINAVRQISDNSIHASEQNPDAVLAEFATIDNPSETDTKYMADAVALDVQPMMDDTLANPSVDGDNLKQEASNPSQVDVTGNALGDSSRDEDNLEKEINNPSQVDDTSNTLGNSNRDGDNLEKEPSNPSQVDVTSNTQENSSGDADNLEKENGNPSQVDVEDKPSQVGVVNQEKPDALEAETPAENTQLHAMQEVEDQYPSDMGLASEEMKLESVEVESMELQTLSDPVDVEKSHVNEEEKTVRASSDEHAFETGCILVEFMREEAACIAAHCLNGRPYDGRPVEVSYVAHDLYLEQFPR